MKRIVLTLVGGAALILGCNNKENASKVPKVNIYEEGEFRYIETNGVPNHKTGEFPTQFCPFGIGEKEFTYKVPLTPTESEEKITAGQYMFGVAVNGVVFDPAGPFWNKDMSTGWEFHPASQHIRDYFGVDLNNAHTQPLGPNSDLGLYHYHGLPTKLIDSLSAVKESQMLLLGYAADGYPIYNQFAPSDPMDLSSTMKEMKPGYKLKTGSRQSGEPEGDYNGAFVQDYNFIDGHGDLDEYNGRYGITEEYPEGTYYYCITQDFPNMPLYFRGEPNASFQHEGPGNEMAEVAPQIRDWPAQP